MSVAKTQWQRCPTRNKRLKQSSGAGITGREVRGNDSQPETPRVNRAGVGGKDSMAAMSNRKRETKAIELGQHHWQRSQRQQQPTGDTARHQRQRIQRQQQPTRDTHPPITTCLLVDRADIRGRDINGNDIQPETQSRACRLGQHQRQRHQWQWHQPETQSYK